MALQPYDPTTLPPLLQVAALQPNPPQQFTGGGRMAPGYTPAELGAAMVGNRSAKPAASAASPAVSAKNLQLADLLSSGGAQTYAAGQALQQDQALRLANEQAGMTGSGGVIGTGARMLAEALLNHRVDADQTKLFSGAAADRANAAARAQAAADAAAPATTPAAPPPPASTGSLDGDLKAAFASAAANAASGAPGQSPSGIDPTPGAAGLGIDGRTSASGSPLMIGGPPPGGNLGIPAGGQPDPATSDFGSPQHLGAALQAMNAGGGAATQPAGAQAASMADFLDPSGASASMQAAPPSFGGGAGGGGGSYAIGLDPSLLASLSAGQRDAGSGVASGVQGYPSPQQLAVAQGPPQPYGVQGLSSPQAAAGAGSAPGVSPATRAFSFFIGRGYSPAQASGIVGNLQAESGINSAAYNPQERAGGIAQWRGARLDGLKAYAAANGGTPDDLDTQLSYLDHELRTSEGHAGVTLQNASDPVQAAAALGAYFRPAGYTPGGDPSAMTGWRTRSGAAQAAMSAFGRGAQAQQAAMLAARGLPPGSVQLAQAGASDAPLPGVGGGQGQPGAIPAIQYGQAETTRERAVIGALIGSPDPGQRAQALSMLQAIQDRELQPIGQDAHYDASTDQTTYVPKVGGQGRAYTVDGQGREVAWRPGLPSGMAYGQDGVARPIAGTGYVDAGTPAPGVVAQRGPDGQLHFNAIPNAAGSAPEGTAWNGQSYAPVPGASYGAPARIAGTDQIGQLGPNGSIKSVGSVSLGPKDLQTIQSGYASSEEAKNYSEALAARRAMGVAASQANGAGDYAMLDTYARAINPGAVARLGTIEAIKQSRDVPAQIRGDLQHWGPNGGTLSPASRQQLLNSTDAFVGSRWQALQPRLQDAADFARRNGVDPAAVVPRFDAPQPSTPVQSTPSALISAARDAIQRGASRAAVIQRLQARGVNPAGL